MEKVCAVILAAGDGTRMKSSHPKVLGEVLFRPMVLWVADALEKAGISDCVAVLGGGKEQVLEVLPDHFAHVLQEERMGTGHAVAMAKDYIKDGEFQDVVILYGDAPFVSAEDIEKAYRQHKEQRNAITVFSARLRDPFGYGRIVRGANGIKKIVEQKDADVDTLEIDEVNAGVYWFNAGFLLFCLEELRPRNAQNEYYLTDTIAIAVKAGKPVHSYGAVPETVMGANDRRGLSLLNEIARKREIERLLEAGVDIPFADQVVIGPQVEVGPDTQILPGTILAGRTVIGCDCVIGPNSHVQDSTIENGSQIIASFVQKANIGEQVKIGPMSNIRPGSVIRNQVKIGDFVEVKNSEIGASSSVAHLTYVGDTDVGERCNFGCGVVTVNYDGTGKYRTTIGDGAFIGCNTNLIAPVSLGDRVYCAAGTTVTEDVPDDALVIGRSRQTVKEKWNKNGEHFQKGK